MQRICKKLWDISTCVHYTYCVVLYVLSSVWCSLVPRPSAIISVGGKDAKGLGTRLCVVVHACVVCTDWGGGGGGGDVRWQGRCHESQTGAVTLR